jgi:hypothetical protein
MPHGGAVQEYCSVGGHGHAVKVSGPGKKGGMILQMAAAVLSPAATGSPKGKFG